ncbi:MAG: TerB family tellurite resistance protein [Cyclobacteriaceae bacterium]
MYNKEEYLSILVHLSKADNYLAESESDLIHYIGEQNGLSKEEIEKIIDNPMPIPSFRTLPRQDRFQYLFDIIQMMKIDGKVFSSEINFAEKMALKLGFKPGVVAELSAYIYSDPKIVTNRSFLINLAADYMIEDEED